MNKNIHYKPDNKDKKFRSKNPKTNRSLIRYFKKRIRKLFKMITPEDME